MKDRIIAYIPLVLAALAFILVVFLISFSIIDDEENKKYCKPYLNKPVSALTLEQTNRCTVQPTSIFIYMPIGR